MWSGACGAMVCGALQPRNSSCRHELGRPVRAVLGAARLMRVPIVTCNPSKLPLRPILSSHSNYSGLRQWPATEKGWSRRFYFRCCHLM